MFFVFFILSFCNLTEILLNAEFVVSLNVISSLKTSKIAFNTHEDFNNTKFKNTSEIKGDSGYKPFSFITNCWNFNTFNTKLEHKIQINVKKHNKTCKINRNLKLFLDRNDQHTNSYGTQRDSRESEDQLEKYNEDKFVNNSQELEEVAKDEVRKLGKRSRLKFSDYFISTPPWSAADDLRVPYMMTKEDLTLSLEKWPENCFLRVKIYSYYRHLASLAVKRIQLGLKDNPNLKVTNPMALPMRRKRWCYLSSPFVDKRSKDLIEIQEHVRVVDIVPVDNGNPRNFTGLLMVPMPEFVSFDYWFEEVHKPVKSRLIHDLFKDRKWVSKYFLYHRDKHEKKDLIDKLTSPELVNEIPLRWKRKHKLDYFFLQLCELRKLYNFVVTRKAEDEARRFYNVKMPDIWQVDDVRFIGTQEDRRFDPDYTNVDKL
uniref:30S ribosomal protein S10-like protein, putative n=1 Tax=Theileria annulata TaxID=5874 RepID=A0A3B0N155_THEAN